MKSFSIKTLGCKVNSYESDFIRSIFISRGYICDEENPDIVVINTCSVTNNANKKSKKEVRAIMNNHKNAVVAVIGCQSEYANRINEEPLGDVVLGNKDKSKVVDYIETYMKTGERIIKFYEDKSEFENMEMIVKEHRTRAFVKIEDGCNNYCSYCVIPYLRGNQRSKDMLSVIEEIKGLLSNNHKEIVLTGIHTGAYYDKNNSCDLYKLLTHILPLKSLYRLRISSIEIVEINDNIISLLNTSNNFMPHFHVPLQSGCDKTLKAMNRRYNLKEYENIINKIKLARENINLTTDVIVGFPGETEEDFNDTLEFCKKIEFSKIHVFPYSDRDNTVASKMKDKVSEEVKNQRSRRLIELSDSLRRKYYNKFINTNVKVLFEEEKDGYYYGFTENYMKVKVKGNYELNEIYDICINEENYV